MLIRSAYRQKMLHHTNDLFDEIAEPTHVIELP